MRPNRVGGTGGTSSGPWKHVIWDWNGTIVDDLWLSAELISAQSLRHGLAQVSLDDYREKIVFPISDFYVRLGFDLEAKSFELLNTEFVNEYHRRRFECRPHQGIAELIRELSDTGIGSSVLSAYQQSMLEQAVAHYGLARCFRAVKGLAHTLADNKISAGRELLGSLPYSCGEILIVGDCSHDAEVARALGASCALFSRGHESRSRLMKSGYPVVESAESLRGMILERG